MLKGKVAVVTGGTRGIGYATVRKFLQNGAKVVLFGSRAETVEKALASLKAENGEWEVDGDYPNLSDAKEVKAAIQNGIRMRQAALLRSGLRLQWMTSLWSFAEIRFIRLNTAPLTLPQNWRRI